MSSRFDGLEARIAETLARSVPGASVVSCQPLPGGHSGFTLLVEAEGVPDGRLVAKCGAPGRPAAGRHDIVRQARAIAAVHDLDGVAVPTIIGQDAGDPHVVLMTFAPGDATEPILDGDGAMAPDVVRARALAAARMLGRLHRATPDELGLGAEPVASLEVELERWSRVMAAVDPTLVEGQAELSRALAACFPPPAAPALVHGDYRLGNILFDGTRPSAIIDWEIWAITDPRVDLGWFLLHADHHEYEGVGLAAPGMPSVEELVATYAEIAGPVQDLPWFMAFTRFKMAAIMAHNLRRHREGRFHDPFQERLPPTIAGLVRRGLVVFSGSA